MRLEHLAYFTLIALVSTSALAADGYSSPYGEWRGQTQYQAKIKNESDPGAHAVMPIVISIDPGGKVTGGSPENGCRLLGIAVQDVSPNILMLDVTRTNCTYAAYNRSYRGHIALHSEKKYAHLSLLAISTMCGKGGTFTVEATTLR